MGTHGKKMKKWLLAASLTAMALSAEVDTNRILFLVHRGELSDAIELYQEGIESGKHDHETIEQMCQLILEQGFKDPDPEIQLTTLFGAGIAANEKALYIIEEAMRSPFPPIQLAALGMLARSQQEDILVNLRHALRSPYLILRLEALFLLAESKDPKTASYAESLMAIVNEELLPVFPPILAEAGDGPSTKILRKLLAHKDENVRLATILALTKHKRDDFLPKIRTLATHHSPRQLEDCAYAFGVLKDESAVPRLQQIATSTHDNTKLAALYALYNLGRKDVKGDIERMALAEDLFAIAALGDINGSDETLAQLVNSQNPHVRINASIGLLLKKDKRCINGLAEILLKDTRDYAFVKVYTNGKSASAWKVVPSAQQQQEELPGLIEQTLSFKAAALIAALELDEKIFLQIAEAILSSRQNDLVPALIPLLENKQTPEVIALLQRYQQKAGAPLIRQHCNLALYRLKVDGPYERLVKEWITGHMNESMFRFKAVAPNDSHEHGSFDLSPDETSKLLIESIEALARAQNTQSIDILLELIKSGHPKNKYALAGLLMRVTQ